MSEMFVMLTGLPKRSVPRGSNLDFFKGSNLLLTGDGSAPPVQGAILCGMLLGGLLKH